MIDLKTVADTLYAPRVPDVPVVPPVEAKPTAEPTTTTPARQQAADATTTEPTTARPYTLALPQDAVLEARAIERTTAFANAAGLSPEAAQKALEHANGEVAAFQEQQTVEWHTLTRETWVNEVKSDPEIGGEQYDGAVTDAKRFLERFGDEEIRRFLDDTGFGNNKYVIRIFARAEKGMTNEQRVKGQVRGRGVQKDVATTLYGTNPRR